MELVPFAQGRRRRPGQSKKKKKEAASCKLQAPSSA